MRNGDLQTIAAPDRRETEYIEAMSRDSVIEVYSKWTDISRAEQICLEYYLPDNPRVLDLGCGTGRMLHALGERASFYRGIDSSAPMIERAKKLHPNHDFLVGDILSVEKGGDEINTILLMHNVIDALYPLERRSHVLKLAYDIIEPEGILICSSHLTSGSQSRGYTQEIYHGAEITSYRSSLVHLITEIEESGYEVMTAIRDYRQEFADWAYVAAKKVIG